MEEVIYWTDWGWYASRIENGTRAWYRIPYQPIGASRDGMVIAASVMGLTEPRHFASVFALPSEMTIIGQEPI